MRLPKRLSYLYQVIMQVFVCILLLFPIFLIGYFLYGLLSVVVPDNLLIPVDVSISVPPIMAVAIFFLFAIMFLLSILSLLGYVKNIFNLIKLIINPDLDIDIL